MIPVLLPVLLILAAGTATTGLDADLPEDPEAEIVRLENELMRAFQSGDRPTLERIIDERFLLTSATSHGEQIDKRRYIDGGLDLSHLESFRFHDFRVRHFGATAIVSVRLDWSSTWAGMQWDSDFILTDVWQRNGEAWQIVSRHSSYSAEDD